MTKMATLALASLVALAVPAVGTSFLAAGTSIPAAVPDTSSLVAGMRAAAVTLDKGIEAAVPTGVPVSAKFEMVDGQLRLAVATVKDSTFTRVVVDPTTGSVSASEVITSAAGLAEATSQSLAMAKAHSPLIDAVSRVARENEGFTVISVEATLTRGRPFANILLLRGSEWKSVSDSLE